LKRESAAEKTKRLLLHEKRLSSAGYRAVAGVDEAGRGPLAGPVVAGAVILKSLKFRQDIDDSKKLSDKKRRAAYREILKKAEVGIGIVDEKRIDEINIYRATIEAMQNAIADLDIPPDYIIVDGRMKLATKPPIKCIVGGDSKSLSIAAASIIAKVTRDDIMLSYHDEYPQYSFARHKGYATKAHKRALKKHGPSPIHRRSFAPVKSLIPLHNPVIS
jgi:ribonuclease HII